MCLKELRLIINKWFHLITYNYWHLSTIIKNNIEILLSNERFVIVSVRKRDLRHHLFKMFMRTCSTKRRTYRTHSKNVQSCVDWISVEHDVVSQRHTYAESEKITDLNKANFVFLWQSSGTSTLVRVSSTMISDSFYSYAPICVSLLMEIISYNNH